MIPHPPQKPPLTAGSALTIGGIKEVLKEPDPHSLPAQLSRTSAMRLLTLALLGICCLTAYIVEGKSRSCL